MAETDYLIVGAGTVGMAFAYTLLAETDAHLTIVDREVAPGRRLNHALVETVSRRDSACDMDADANNGHVCNTVAGVRLCRFHFTMPWFHPTCKSCKR